MFGVNISSTVKNKPYIVRMYDKRPLYKPFGTIPTGEVVENLKASNIQLIRQLIILDECIDDETGGLRCEYLNEFAQVSQELLAGGFKVILDFHQDAYCRYLGGCGLPRKYMPEKYQTYTKKIKNGGENWGATPIRSKKQSKCWKHFYENMTDEYARDITNVAAYLEGRLQPMFYQYIDIINEPGNPLIYNLQFLVRSSDEYRSKLTGLYEKAVTALHAQLQDENVEYLIEPFNYDVSQVGRKYLGLEPLQLPQHLLDRLVYAPHIYEPLSVPVLDEPAHNILRNHLLEMKKLGIYQVIIGEFGDLTNGTNPERFEAQIRLLEQLGLDKCVWEYDVCYGSNTYVYEQDFYAWNMEQMSVNIRPDKPSAIGEIYYKYSRYGAENKVLVDNELVGTDFERLKLTTISFYRGEESQPLYNFVYSVSSAKEILSARLQCLSRGVHMQVIEGQFIATDRRLRRFKAAKMARIRYEDGQCIIYKGR